MNGRQHGTALSYIDKTPPTISSLTCTAYDFGIKYVCTAYDRGCGLNYAVLNGSVDGQSRHYFSSGSSSGTFTEDALLHLENSYVLTWFGVEDMLGNMTTVSLREPLLEGGEMRVSRSRSSSIRFCDTEGKVSYDLGVACTDAGGSAWFTASRYQHYNCFLVFGNVESLTARIRKSSASTWGTTPSSTIVTKSSRPVWCSQTLYCLWYYELDTTKTWKWSPTNSGTLQWNNIDVDNSCNEYNLLGSLHYARFSNKSISIPQPKEGCVYCTNVVDLSKV